MSPCPQNICTGGDAVWCLASGLQDLGYGVDTGKLNRIFVTRGAYSGNCDVDWNAVENVGAVRYVGTKQLFYNQACADVYHRYVLVAFIYREGNRPVLVTSCDGLGNYRVRDPRNQRTTVNHLEASKFIIFA